MSEILNDEQVAVEGGFIEALAPDYITRSQWADRYSKRFTYIKTPEMLLAFEGVLWQCLADLKISDPQKRLVQIHDIRRWIWDETAPYQFSVVIEALETVLPGLTIEGARVRFIQLLDRAEEEAQAKLGAMLA